MNEVNVAVIGLGFMGSKHAQVYELHPLAKLRAVADISEDRLLKWKNRLPDIQIYQDYEEMLSEENLDAVTVATPETLHVHPVASAAQNGVDVLLEKPLAHTVNAGENIVEICNNSEINLVYGSILRFDPRYYTAYKKSKSGEIGDIISLSLSRTLPGYLCEDDSGILHPALTTTIHELDIACWIAGADIDDVSARGDNNPGEEDYPEILFVTIKFSNGIMASIQTSMRGQGDYIGERCVVTGTEGQIEVSNGSNCGVKIKNSESTVSPDLLHWPEFRGRIKGDLYWEIDYFLDSVRNGINSFVTAEDGLKALKLAKEIESQT